MRHEWASLSDGIVVAATRGSCVGPGWPWPQTQDRRTTRARKERDESGIRRSASWYRGWRPAGDAARGDDADLRRRRGTSGNVSSVVLGRNATPARVAALNADLHLNEPLTNEVSAIRREPRHWTSGRLVASLAQGRVLPVWNVISQPLRNSLILAGLTLIIYVSLCLFLGTLAALRAGRRTDHTISLAALSIGAMPEFLVGTVLIVVFFTKLNLLPPVSQINPDRRRSRTPPACAARLDAVGRKHGLWDPTGPRLDT